MLNIHCRHLTEGEIISKLTVKLEDDKRYIIQSCPPYSMFIILKNLNKHLFSFEILLRFETHLILDPWGSHFKNHGYQKYKYHMSHPHLRPPQTISQESQHTAMDDTNYSSQLSLWTSVSRSNTPHTNHTHLPHISHPSRGYSRQAYNHCRVTLSVP